ncbi:unnamed protein product, partial [Coregonus sp. 'balchen']
TASILVKYEDANSEHKKIYPAKIFGPSNVAEGVKVHLKCSTTGIRGHQDNVNVYLCKNGVGIRIAALDNSEDETIFTMKDVTKEDSGNYSCVYIRDKLLPDQVNSTGDYLVFQVYGDGDLEGHQDNVNVYLCENGVGIRIAALDNSEDDTIFIMKNVTKEDSGNYSCVYSRDKLLPSQLKSTGENLVVFKVDGEWKEIYPAKIFGPSNVAEGVKVYFKCSTTGIRGHQDNVNVYLCKNGVGIRIAALDNSEDVTIFTMKDVTKEDSGNYSCVYSRDKLLPRQLTSTGENLVVFKVDGEWKEIYPAKIFGPSNVTEGVKVHFKCSTTGIRRHQDNVNVYLCKNGVGIRIAALDNSEDDTIFIMKDVTKEDSGNYSCVYSRDKLLPSELKSTGENLVVFKVDVEWKEGLKNVGARVAAALVLLFLMLSVLLLLWRYWGILKQ